MDSKLTTLKRSVAARIGRMTKDRAAELYEAFRKESTARMYSMHNTVLSEVTGGYNSQSLNAWVTRKLAVKAGLIKGDLK